MPLFIAIIMRHRYIKKNYTMINDHYFFLIYVLTDINNEWVLGPDLETPRNMGENEKPWVRTTREIQM